MDTNDEKVIVNQKKTEEKSQLETASNVLDK